MRDSKLMARMLRQANDARTAIAAGDQVSALDHVNEALGLIQEVKTLPNRRQALNFVPIYSELESVSVIGPIQAERQAAGIQPSGAAARMMPGTSVASATGDYTVVGVDVPMAESHLQAARLALSESDLQTANANLAAVQNGVTMVTVAGDMPLLRARQNLALASAAVKSGNPADAVAPLKAASKALSTYAQTAGPHVNEANNLISQINSYATVVAQNPPGAAQRIDDWWNEVSTWFSGTTPGVMPQS